MIKIYLNVYFFYFKLVILFTNILIKKILIFNYYYFKNYNNIKVKFLQK